MTVRLHVPASCRVDVHDVTRLVASIRNSHQNMEEEEGRRTIGPPQAPILTLSTCETFSFLILTSNSVGLGPEAGCCRLPFLVSRLTFIVCMPLKVRSDNIMT